MRYSADFLRVYEAYPVHRNKKEASEVWKRLKPDAALVDAMLAAISRMKAQDRQWRAGFVVGFNRWLRGQHWEDEPEPERPEAGGKIVHLHRPTERDTDWREYNAFRAEMASYGFPTEGPLDLAFFQRFGVMYEEVIGDYEYANVLRFVRDRLGIPEDMAAADGG